MRIEIDEAVANDSASHKWLDRLLHKVDDGWHVLVVDDDRLQQTSWVSARGAAGAWVEELLIAAVKLSGWASSGVHGRSIQVVLEPKEKEDLRPEDAARFAEEPLIVLVENEESDGAFVERIVEVLDPQLHVWWQRPGKPGRVDSRGGGGQMDLKVRQLAAQPPRPRLVVLVDSDRSEPGGTISETTAKVQRACQDLGVSCWVSAKRESENYLPEALLEIWPDQDAHRRRRVMAWERLSDDQKDVYDMKEGLDKLRERKQEHLFADLNAIDANLLKLGFGPHVYRCWSSMQSKRLPRPTVEHALMERSGPDLSLALQLIRQEV